MFLLSGWNNKYIRKHCVKYENGNIQGGCRKFLGHFKCHFESLISFKSI